MKTTLVVFAVVLATAFCGAVGCRMLANRPTQATIPLRAKPPGKAAIVYFSQSQVGNTAIMARWIQKHTGGDLIPLEPANPYPKRYRATVKAARREVGEGRSPALKTMPRLDGYEVVFLGSPVWYGSYAPPLKTFLAANALEGKTVAPFCAHGGGGLGHFADDLRNAIPKARVLEALALRGSNQFERRLGLGVTLRHSEDEVVNWLNRIFAAPQQDSPNPSETGATP